MALRANSKRFLKVGQRHLPGFADSYELDAVHLSHLRGPAKNAIQARQANNSDRVTVPQPPGIRDIAMIPTMNCSSVTQSTTYA